MKDGKDLAILTIGPIAKETEKAIQKAEEENGLSIAHFDMRFLKPIDTDILHEVGKRFKHAITVEDGVINGGLGSTVIEFMNDHEYPTMISRIGIPDDCTAERSAICDRIAELMKENKSQYIRRCRSCGKELPIGAMFNYCEDCYTRGDRVPFYR